jgi:hypothetical protein
MRRYAVYTTTFSDQEPYTRTRYIISHTYAGFFRDLCNREPRCPLIVLNCTEIKNNEVQTVYIQFRNEIKEIL